ncbi:MAG TPA: hypothetical protein VF599_02390 [Pyrinomonadaceae bacterium]|jgi:hypothetical protein
MKKLFFVSVVCVLIIFAGVIETAACSCLALPAETTLNQAVRKAYKDSNAIFSGKVLAIAKNPNSGFVIVKFKVDKSWKGKISSILSVKTGIGGGDCGYQFEIGKKYLVYTHGDNAADLGVSICSRTALLEANTDTAILSKIKRPKEFKSFPK